MNLRDLSAPSQVKELIKQYEFRFKKRFGQNFIVDKNILDKIVAGAQLQPEDYVVEIGPGIGTLTQAMAPYCKQVVAFEIDRDLVAILRETLTHPNITVISGDALALSWRAPLEEQGWSGEPIKLVANLPYYLTTPLVMKALEGDVPFESLVVMVQREVAERMKATPGGKDYGILSLATQYYTKPTLLTIVPLTVFMPAPDVDSAVIRLDRIAPPVDAPKEELFRVIRMAFSQRRKTIRNSLKPLLKEWLIDGDTLDEIFGELSLDPGSRGETFSLEHFSELTKKLLACKLS